MNCSYKYHGLTPLVFLKQRMMHNLSPKKQSSQKRLMIVLYFCFCYKDKIQPYCLQYLRQPIQLVLLEHPKPNDVLDHFLGRTSPCGQYTCHHIHVCASFHNDIDFLRPFCRQAWSLVLLPTWIVLGALGLQFLSFWRSSISVIAYIISWAIYVILEINVNRMRRKR